MAELRCGVEEKCEPRLKWDYNTITHARCVTNMGNSSQMTRRRSMKSFRWAEPEP